MGETVLESWRAQPVSLGVLRAFLGVTFVYAGVQKLSDPNFLHAGSPDYIGTQIQGFARGSPIGGLLHLLAQAPLLTGLGIALAEIAIGLGILAGIAPLLFALSGFVVNLALTLSASWHVHPYFLGSDSIYAVAWIALFLGTAESARRRRRANTPARRTASRASNQMGRRDLMRGALLAGATLLTSAAMAGSPTTRAGGARTGRRMSGAGQDSPHPLPTVQGTPIASLASVPVGGAIGFEAPGVGPAALVRLGQDRVVAYSRVCTHAGCLVQYDASARLLVCPCHGAEFDPGRDAAVVAGPAPTPLAPVRVEVDRSTGRVVLPT
jgi:thiosulfate dehydrogenase [quinone] large subunit